MIGIIDYGMGNLRSVQKAVEFLGGKAVITAEQSELNQCGRLILPGVGSFARAWKIWKDGACRLRQSAGGGAAHPRHLPRDAVSAR